LLTAGRCNYPPGLAAWRAGEPILVRERTFSSVTSRRQALAVKAGWLVSDI
jgi:hypothetical protein